MIKESSFINELMTTPISSDCLNSTLLMAVQSGDTNRVGKLILYGATNIDEALTESHKSQQHSVTITLLIIKASMDNDRIFLLKLYGENVQGHKSKIRLTEDDLDAIMCKNQFQINTPRHITYIIYELISE